MIGTIWADFATWMCYEHGHRLSRKTRIAVDAEQSARPFAKTSRRLETYSIKIAIPLPNLST